MRMSGKQAVGVLLAAAMVVVCGCGERAGGEGGISAPEKLSNASVTKIDLSEPKNHKYLDWLKAYLTSRPRPSDSPDRAYFNTTVVPSTHPKPDKPNIKESRVDVWVKAIEENQSHINFATENWKTWEWNDTWELELYLSKSDDWYIGWDVLRARNKITGETLYIDEMFNEADIGMEFWSSFEMTHIDETYVVYNTGDIDSLSFHFFALGQSEGQDIGDRGYAGFLDEAHTKWWRWEQENGLYYTDLRKLAAGDADAERAVIEGDQYLCRNGWMAECGGRSVACFFVLTYGEQEGGGSFWYYPLYLVVYDPLDDEVLGFLEVPIVDGKAPGADHPDKFYLFGLEPAKTLLRKGDLSAAEFYVLDLDG